MAKKYPAKVDQIQPGPGSYNPEKKFHSKVKKYPKFTFGSKYDTSSISTNDNPGPGMYDTSNRNSIGKSKNSKSAKFFWKLS